MNKRIKNIKRSFRRLQANQLMDEAYSVARYCVGHSVEEVADHLELSVEKIERYLEVYAMCESIGEPAMKKLLAKT